MPNLSHPATAGNSHYIDPKLAFLARASARHYMVELEMLSVDDAFDALIRPFIEITTPAPRQHPPQPRPTPQVTIEAVLHCVRERGLASLKEAENVARLASCDASAKAEINRRIEKRSAAA